MTYGKIEIIVRAWDKERGRVYGARLSWIDDATEALALEDASRYCRSGLCVIVRPHCNDDDLRMMFHEFRSFDGAPFSRIDFGPMGEG